jgi:hypothetical protein
MTPCGQVWSLRGEPLISRMRDLDDGDFCCRWAARTASRAARHWSESSYLGSA